MQAFSWRPWLTPLHGPVERVNSETLKRSEAKLHSSDHEGEEETDLRLGTHSEGLTTGHLPNLTANYFKCNTVLPITLCLMAAALRRV